MDIQKNMVNASDMEAMQVIVERYLSFHGTGAYTYRPFYHGGIYRREDYRYHADLKLLLPGADLGTFSYIWGVYEASLDQDLRFALFPYGPVSIYVNGKLVGHSDIFSERYRSKQIFELPMKKGSNELLLLCENTSGGFGCEFGTWVGKLDYYFLMPPMKTEQEGLCYSKSIPKPLAEVTSESLLSIHWFPEDPKVTARELALQDVFPQARKDQYILAHTHLDLQKEGWISFGSNLEILVDNQLVQGSMKLESGLHTLSVFCNAATTHTLEITYAKSDEEITFTNPLSGFSPQYKWLLAGPFDRRPVNFEIQYDKPFITSEGVDFWHLQGIRTYLRLYNDNPLFGHWNYPLGVTLYGLVESERILKGIHGELSQRISSYLISHVQISIDTYAYALWDKETLGGSTAVHHLMTSLDSLDDCGSFGATLLEIVRDHQVIGYEQIVEVVGNYISKLQPRLSDGTFFRTGLMHEFHENTLWVDDLYMSVPFLCRYSQFKGKRSYLDDAANQFFGFAKYLYMEDEQLMSHVYDFDRTIATGIPWGRGNGWALFSLSELLMVLDLTHPKRGDLLALFRNLSKGILRLQDENGMFHQVLNMSSSYLESSCTAMFACAFSRGVRMGWYGNPYEYEQGCKRACQALKEQAIDYDGHVWGVCRGSEFSCSPQYYAEQLLPRLDDTHGIGIILLALCERMKLG